MNSVIIKIVFPLLFIFIFSNCKDSGHYQSINTTNTSKVSDETHLVIAKELLDAGTYSYVKVSENNEEYWVAIPKSTIEIGNLRRTKKKPSIAINKILRLLR